MCDWRKLVYIYTFVRIYFFSIEVNSIGLGLRSLFLSIVYDLFVEGFWISFVIFLFFRIFIIYGWGISILVLFILEFLWRLF